MSDDDGGVASGITVDVECDADDLHDDLSAVTEEFEAMADAADRLDDALRRIEMREVHLEFTLKQRGLGPETPEDRP